VASLSQGRTAAAQCGLFTYKSVPVIFEPPCIFPCYFSFMIPETFLLNWVHRQIYLFKSTVSVCGGVAYLEVRM